MVVDERDHHFARRSSSAWAKYADAFRRISLARFSSTILALELLQLAARSSVVRPGRWPASRSAWRTQRRSVSVRAARASRAIASESPPTATDARPRARSTSRTARSRTSGEYLLGRAMGSILSTNGPSDKPGTLRDRASGCALLSAGGRSAAAGRKSLRQEDVRLVRRTCTDARVRSAGESLLAGHERAKPVLASGRLCFLFVAIT